MSTPAPSSAAAPEAEDAQPISIRPDAMRLALMLATALALFHLYAALAGTVVLPGFPLVSSEVLRRIHAGGALALIFILYPGTRNRLGPWLALVLAAAALGLIAYALGAGDALARRATRPEPADVVIACAFVLVLLEATRRATGWVVPAIAALFIAYGLFGPLLPPPWNHRGYSIERLAGHLFITNEGIFGLPLYVSATVIVMFSIYGAILRHSGAGAFFIAFSMALLRKGRNGPARSVLLSSFLLGGPSGSGVATTVMLASVAYPVLAKAGMKRNAAGGLLAAGGLGAVLSPPVLGSAAFLIAEYLRIDYLTVLVMTVVPCCLYYLSLLLMVEIEPQLPRTEPDDTRSPWALLAGGWHHFVSVFAVVGFLAMGMSVALSAIWACVVAIGLSQFDRPNAMGPRRVARALGEGMLGSAAVAATCATAGIIVGVVTLTGVGLKFSAVMIDMGAGGVWPTLMLATIVVWVMGLAVPIAASYIICTVIVAPALVHLGVPLMAAHMFIFYYAVLSDVSPPTALSPFAAAAITGGSPLMTTLETWKYTLPAFLVPLVLVGDPQGVALLLQPLPETGWIGTGLFIAATAGGLAAIVMGARYLLTAPRAPLPGALLVVSAMGLLFPALFVGIPPDWVRIGALAVAGLATLVLWNGRGVRRQGTGAA